MSSMISNKELAQRQLRDSDDLPNLIRAMIDEFDGSDSESVHDWHPLVVQARAYLAVLDD